MIEILPCLVFLGLVTLIVGIVGAVIHDLLSYKEP